jgi:hypothetical protein
MLQGHNRIVRLCNTKSELGPVKRAQNLLRSKAVLLTWSCAVSGVELFLGFEKTQHLDSYFREKTKK